MIISNSKELGLLIKTTRKTQGMTQAELAGASGTGVRFIVDIERGKPTCELEKTLLIVSMLGIKLEACLPADNDNI